MENLKPQWLKYFTGLGLATFFILFIHITHAAPPPLPPNDAANAVLQSGPLILNTPGQTHTLQTSIRFSGNGVYIAAPNVTLDLNGHAIYYGANGAANTYGVINYISWHNTEISIPGATDPIGSKIINGSIIHEGNGTKAHGIYGYRGNNALINDVKVEVYGTDTHTIWFSYSNATVSNCLLISHTQNSLDRHAGPANVHFGNNANAFRNVLIGGNSGFNVGAGSSIKENIISQNSIVTNGYGVFLYGDNLGDPEITNLKNVTVADNLILPSNGRGVILNRGVNVQVLNNVILHLESPNTEFGDGLNPPAIRARYQLKDNIIRGNISLGIAGGGRTATSGLYLSNAGVGASTYENNNLTTILVGSADGQHYAQPLTLERISYTTVSKDLIRNNLFRSNHILIRIDGFDGSSKNNDPMVGNDLSWVDGNTARADFMAAAWAKLQAIGMNTNPDAAKVLQDTDNLIGNLISGVGLNPNRTTWMAKHYKGFSQVTLLDSEFGPGVDPAQVRAEANHWDGFVNIRVGETVRARLVNTSGIPLSNTNFVLSTEQNDSYPLTTDAAGLIDIPVIEFGMDRADPGNSPFINNPRTQSILTVSGYPQVTKDNDTLLSEGASGAVVTIIFGGASSDNIPPVITEVAFGAITSNGAIISWKTTGEESDSLVEFRVVGAPSWSSSGNPALVTDHNIILTGLTASGNYEFRVRSQDLSGNKTTSGIQNFTTLAAPSTPEFTINASAGAHGNISPAGSVTVTNGANQTFTFTANPGYHIADVLVNNVSVGAVGQYIFENVSSGHTISATFATDGTTPPTNPPGGGGGGNPGHPGGDPQNLPIGETPVDTAVQRFVNVIKPGVNDFVDISFALATPQHVRIQIFNREGLIRDLIDEEKSARIHNVRWDGKNNDGGKVVSGTYFAVIELGGEKTTKKIAVVR